MKHTNSEEMIEKKIYEIVNCILNKFIEPTIKVDQVTEIDDKRIDKLIEEYQIEGIILDIDNTIRKNMSAIPQCNEEWIDMIKGKLKVIVVSNGIDGKVKELMETKGIEYIGLAYKPLKKNFLKACKKMDIKPEHVLVVGDSLWADIHGGNKNNMKTALVEKVEEEER